MIGQFGVFNRPRQKINNGSVLCSWQLILDFENVAAIRFLSPAYFRSQFRLVPPQLNVLNLNERNTIYQAAKKKKKSLKSDENE